jgi:hypothetical protein
MIQTAINLPDDVVAELCRRAPQPDQQVIIVEKALRFFFAKEDAANKELEILNRYADELNREAEDVFDYQVIH